MAAMEVRVCVGKMEGGHHRPTYSQQRNREEGPNSQSKAGRRLGIQEPQLLCRKFWAV